MKPNTLFVLQSVAGIASALPAGPRDQADAVAKRDDADLQATADNILQAMAIRLQMEAPVALSKREKPVELMDEAELKAIADNMNAQLAEAAAAMAVDIPAVEFAKRAEQEQAPPTLETQMQALAQQLDAHKQAAAAAANLDTAPIPVDQLEQAAAVSPDQLQSIADQMNAQFEAAGIDPAAPAPGALEARQLVSPQQIAALAQQLSENLAAAAAAAGLDTTSLPSAEEDAAMTPEEMQALANSVAASAGAGASVVANPTAPPTAPTVPVAKRANPAEGIVLPENPTAADLQAAADKMNIQLVEAIKQENGGVVPAELEAEIKRQASATVSIMAFSQTQSQSQKRADPAAGIVLPENPTAADLQKAADQMKVQLSEAIKQEYGGVMPAELQPEIDRQAMAAVSIMAFAQSQQ